MRAAAALFMTAVTFALIFLAVAVFMGACGAFGRLVQNIVYALVALVMGVLVFCHFYYEAGE